MYIFFILAIIFNGDYVNIIPSIIEKNNGNNSYVYDIYSKMLEKRIVFLNGEINDSSANLVICQLLYLDSISSDDICLYINSPGGSVINGLAIYDTINFIKSDVSTTCIGECASMGAILLASGKKGKRYALKNSEIMIHQPIGGVEGQVSDIKIHATRILKTRDIINHILASCCNKKLSVIEKDTDRDYFMSAQDALDYGLIDKII